MAPAAGRRLSARNWPSYNFIGRHVHLLPTRWATSLPAGWPAGQAPLNQLPLNSVLIRNQRNRCHMHILLQSRDEKIPLLVLPIPVSHSSLLIATLLLANQ